METRSSGHHRVAKQPLLVACVMLGLIAAFFLLREHWGHLAGWWPYLLLLACPLMHVFMHGGHGDAGRRDPPSSRGEADQGPGDR